MTRETGLVRTLFYQVTILENYISIFLSKISITHIVQHISAHIFIQVLMS